MKLSVLTPMLYDPCKSEYSVLRPDIDIISKFFKLWGEVVKATTFPLPSNVWNSTDCIELVDTPAVTTCLPNTLSTFAEAKFPLVDELSNKILSDTL